MPNSQPDSFTPLRAEAGHPAVHKRRNFILPAVLALALIHSVTVPAFSDSLRTLLVGGGPTLAKNQVAIESNVRYLTRLLPGNAAATTLFADGDLNSPTVLYTPAQAGNTEAEIVFNQLYPRPQGRRRDRQTPTANNSAPNETVPRDAAPSDNRPAEERDPGSVSGGTPPVGTNKAADTHGNSVGEARPAAPAGNYKVPHLAKLDGSATRGEIEKAFASLGGLGKSSVPYFLYFTGHGNGVPENRDNNYYSLWTGDKFTVQDLSRQVAQLPQKEPVVLVMVQCYSGAFANILFEGGDPKAKLVERDIVGFFASTKDRTAAGCTPSINEAYYYDFTSYFFSALTGRDRLNRPFQGEADYNKDGKIGLDEAFYWSVIYDKSIDVPVSTSDVFLERFVPLEGDGWQSTEYSTLLKWASPAQRVVLEELSRVLELTGEQRIRDAQNLDTAKLGGEARAKLAEIDERIRAIRDAALPALQAQFPGLTQRNAPEYAEVRRQALAHLENEVGQGKWKELLKLSEERAHARDQSTDSSVYAAKRLRILRVAQKVVRDHALRSSHDKATKKRYFKLLKGEAKSLLPYSKGRLAQAAE